MFDIHVANFYNLTSDLSLDSLCLRQITEIQEYSTVKLDCYKPETGSALWIMKVLGTRKQIMTICDLKVWGLEAGVYPLGMASGEILSRQLTGSFHNGLQCSGNECVTPHTDARAFAKPLSGFCSIEKVESPVYIIADLLVPHVISAYAVMSGTLDGSRGRVGAFSGNLLYSNDLKTMEYYDVGLNMGAMQTTATVFYATEEYFYIALDRSVVARYVRFNNEFWNIKPCFRVEFYGRRLHERQCQFTITDSGYIVSPNYPEYYGQNLKCTWQIRGRNGSYPDLEFEFFKLAPKPESFKVGDDKIMKSSLTKFDLPPCRDTLFINEMNDSEPVYSDPLSFNSESVPEIISSSSQLELRLNTCFKYTFEKFADYGFKVKLSFRDCPGCGRMGSSRCGTREPCQEQCGYLLSPNYPYAYPARSECRWTIKTKQSHNIKLEILDFNITGDTSICIGDSLEIYDFNPYGDDFTVSKYCNDIRPPPVIWSGFQSIDILFRSDLLKEGKGFKIKYETQKYDPPLNISQIQPGKAFGCLDGWVYYKKSCYGFFAVNDTLDWFDAESMCTDYGKGYYNLVAINTEEEMIVLHYLLLYRWAPKRNEVFIGLSNRNLERSWRWSNGEPMSYSDWSMKSPVQPDGGDAEDCTAIIIAGIQSTQNWHDIPCAQKRAHQFICEFRPQQAEVKVPSQLPVLNNTECAGIDGQLFQCKTSKECILKVYQCDGYKQCPDGSDEFNCTESHCPVETFKCNNGRCIPMSFVCDFINHCSDNSDESWCVNQNCDVISEFQCENKQCIPIEKRCDLRRDCADGSDERACIQCRPTIGFQCFDGTCLPIRTRCDGIKDCQGLAGEDELNCLALPSNTSVDGDNIKCKTGITVDDKVRCIYDKDSSGYMLGCRDANHLINCRNFSCPPGYYKCPNSYCIPVRMVCDRMLDCPYGQDEQKCGEFVCPNYYKCNTGENCVTIGDRCNGRRDCSEGDDEFFCHSFCPIGCVCFGLSYFCGNNDYFQIPANISSQSRQLVFSHNRLTFLNSTLNRFHFLVSLNLTHNLIEDLSSSAFLSQVNLRTLDLSQNLISFLQNGSFHGLGNLLNLHLSGNPIQSISPGSFVGLRSLPEVTLLDMPVTTLSENVFDGLETLKLLNLSSSNIKTIVGRIFTSLSTLQTIDIRGNRIIHIVTDLFSGLDPSVGGSLKRLYSDDFKFCCLADWLPPDACLPAADEFSSCTDLMKNQILRICLWVLGSVSLLGNGLVVVWRLVDKAYKKVHDFLITNLAVSDFCMGIYLITVASADVHYRGVYIIHADSWKYSAACKTAGFLSTLATEVSMMILVTIAFDRSSHIIFPFSRHHLKTNSVYIIVACVWGLAIVLAGMPLMGIPYFGDGFYAQSGVCLALPITSKRPDGWMYSVFLFLILTCVGFSMIAASYLWMYHDINETVSSAGNKGGNATQVALARKMTLILFTNFCCWAPIILLGILGSTGRVTIPGDVYAWIAVFVLPVNSATNPILYTLSYATNLRKKKKKSSTTASTAISATKTTNIAQENGAASAGARVVACPRLFYDTSTELQMQSLSSYLKVHGSLNPREMLAIVKDVAEVMKQLHGSGIIIQPIEISHIMLQITDKGIAGAYLSTPTTPAPPSDGELMFCENMQELSAISKKLLRNYKPPKY
ncbi:uncharacterized protein LOC141902250 [Tubulanus polymorphus]|uniref:uncharacterized protein LOC141902250 n=1 Tax=Tubulanus polymorphus TaxID=672921 RepID=UPI003DA6031A